MARMPGAQWRPISINHSNGGCAPRLVILHIIVGSLNGADSWFRNPDSRVSAHFGTGRDGRLIQWVDTSDRAWANAGANGYAVSIENEGDADDALTDAQIDRCAQVLEWAHRVHDVSLAVTNNPGGSGLAYHSMSPSWSLGGTACPGSRVIAQRAEIVQRARSIGDDMPLSNEDLNRIRAIVRDEVDRRIDDIADAVWRRDLQDRDTPDTADRRPAGTLVERIAAHTYTPDELVELVRRASEPGQTTDG
ncbi:N-acetylmuramoyl-L-alanine amidase [Allonocardiopsis opalescens]|uniref:N-acetylmuramoyl-L-alanine amidase n=1 Tax=Allonocardiopsis opalescens TaxID=1144618 RepID=A0A2T0Q2X8_9ACTN|nr:N-acetylmuramoyl-L-alanine amidase [Allonocardiopsis opalescens]PRX98157.1 N-acetylmuramoyl-L-alanine amidase [Allonocardiopsis opalescens]